MIFLVTYLASQPIFEKKRDKICELLSEKMNLLVLFLVISFVDHFFGEIICQFLAKESVKVLLQYLISSI